MSTHNVCFLGEMRKCNIFGQKEAPDKGYWSCEYSQYASDKNNEPRHLDAEKYLQIMQMYMFTLFDYFFSLRVFHTCAS